MVELGVTETELRAMSAARVRALRSAWLERERREDYRAGVLAMILANTARDRKSRSMPYTAGDFFPSLAPAAPAAPSTEEEASALADRVLRLFRSRA